MSTLAGIGDLDPPEHTWVRRLLNVAVAPRALSEAEAHTAGVARRIVDRRVHPDRCDALVKMVAFEISIDTMSALDNSTDLDDGARLDFGDQLAAFHKPNGRLSVLGGRRG